MSSETTPSTELPIRLVRQEQLEPLVRELFCRLGLPRPDAAHVAACLITAELRGIESHGLTRVPIYAKRLRLGIVQPRPRVRVTRTGPSTACVDGDNGMGAVVGSVAIRQAMELAEATGVGWVVVRNSNHFGVAAYYVLQALENRYIALMASNAPPTMAPWGGRLPLLGTNPIAVGVPCGRHPDLLLDMASSVVARGKIILAAQRRERIPPTWALDPEGRPTTDPEAALQGCVLPFGGPKGSGIALLVDVLCGVLSGARFGREVGNLYEEFRQPQDLGHLAVVVDVRRFMPLEAFLERVDRLIDDLKRCPPAEGHSEVLMPGELEHRLTRRRLEEGIPIAADVLCQLRREVQGADLEVPEWLERLCESERQG